MKFLLLSLSAAAVVLSASAQGALAQYRFSGTGYSTQIGGNTYHTFPDGTTGWSNRIGNSTYHNFTVPSYGHQHRHGW